MTVKEIVQRIVNTGTKQLRADGTCYQSLSYRDELRLAEESGCSLKEVQIIALEHDLIPEVYIRNQKSLSSRDQVRLLQTHVAIIGLGGLGGTVTEILARIGVGTLTLVDGDLFEDSNLNRQILSSVDNLGRPKADVAAERVLSINPAVETCAVRQFLSDGNAQTILAGAHIAVDCLDSISSRFILEQACRIRKIPMVSAAIGGTSGQATVVYPEDQGLSRIYGDPGTALPKGVEMVLGTLPFAAISMAAVECAEVVTIALGRPAPLRNRLFITDLTDHTAELIDF